MRLDRLDDIVEDLRALTIAWFQVIGDALDVDIYPHPSYGEQAGPTHNAAGRPREGGAGTDHVDGRIWGASIHWDMHQAIAEVFKMVDSKLLLS